MRFLADMGIALSTVRALRERGHEAIHVREIGCERLSDAAIVEKAKQEGRTILTVDLGFGDLLATGAQSLPSVIIFRLHNETPAIVTEKLVEVLAARSRLLEEGAIVVVEDARHRIRRLPIEEAGELP